MRKGTTTKDLPAAAILDHAPRDMRECLVVGWEADGALYVASTTSDAKRNLELTKFAREIVR